MAVQSMSTAIRKLTNELGIDEIIEQLDEAERMLHGYREEYVGWEQKYRRYKDLSDDKKDQILAEITAENEGASAAAIDRMHKIELVKNETYGGYLGEMRSARDDMSESEMNLKVSEVNVRSLHMKLSVLAGALQAGAAQTRAKTTSNLLSLQAGALAVGQL